MHTVVKYERKGPKNILIEGKYCFNVKHPSALITVFESPAKHLKERVSTLLTIVANINILDDRAYQRLRTQRKDGRPMELPLKKVFAENWVVS